MIRRVAIVTLLVGAFWPTSLFAQAATPTPSSPAQSASANGVIAVLVQPAASAPQGATPISSLLWIYDTNAKAVLLCTSHIDGSFSCSGGVKPNWP